MPAWKERGLTDEQIWSVINYARATFGNSGTLHCAPGVLWLGVQRHRRRWQWRLRSGRLVGWHWSCRPGQRRGARGAAAQHAVEQPVAGAAARQSRAAVQRADRSGLQRRQVLDAAGQAVDRGDGHVDDNDDHLLVVSLQPGLPNGVYTVSWRSLSTIDVHPDAGQYPLFVGVPVSSGAAAAGHQLTAHDRDARDDVRAVVVLPRREPVRGRAGDLEARAERRPGRHAAPMRARLVRRRAQRLIVLGGVLLVLGTLFTAVAQAAAAANVPLLNGLGQPLADLLLRGRFATIWWPRLGLEIASLLLIAFGGLEGMAAESALATLPAVLLTSSLTSHGAALPTEAVPGIAIDWLHILGATAWVGGLVSLVIVLPVAARRRCWRRSAQAACDD